MKALVRPLLGSALCKVIRNVDRVENLFARKMGKYWTYFCVKEIILNATQFLRSTKTICKGIRAGFIYNKTGQATVVKIVDLLRA